MNTEQGVQVSWLRKTGNLKGLTKVLNQQPLPRPLELLLDAGGFVLTSTVIVRRQALLDVGLFDERFQIAEDLDLWMRLARKYRMALSPEPLVQRRIHGDNLTANHRATAQALVAILEQMGGSPAQSGGPQTVCLGPGEDSAILLGRRLLLVLRKRPQGRAYPLEQKYRGSIQPAEFSDIGA